MTPTKDVASRELCEEMARLGICQDEPELWWLKHPINDTWDLFTGSPLQEHKVIAQTLARMMEELGFDRDKYCPAIFYRDCRWVIADWVCSDEIGDIISEDKHLPNAVARALIAIKKFLQEVEK